MTTVTYSLSANVWQSLLFRLILSLIVGAIIGFEREKRNKSAGLRTHMLVSLGSAIFVLVPIELSTAQANFDPASRVIQGITAGVGFVGAGEIIRESQADTASGSIQVRGLTSAVAIWVSAALGTAIGCGLWQLGLMGAIFAWLVLRVFKRLESRF